MTEQSKAESIMKIREAAEKLAAANSAEETIQRIYWFPDETELRIVVIDDASPTSDDEEVHPFYFQPDGEIKVWKALSLLHPDEESKINLPNEWGSWADGKIIFEKVALT